MDFWISPWISGFLADSGFLHGFSAQFQPDWGRCSKVIMLSLGHRFLRMIFPASSASGDSDWNYRACIVCIDLIQVCAKCTYYSQFSYT